VSIDAMSAGSPQPPAPASPVFPPPEDVALVPATPVDPAPERPATELCPTVPVPGSPAQVPGSTGVAREHPASAPKTTVMVVKFFIDLTLSVTTGECYSASFA